ncbi:L-rhamnose mutarotase [Salinibacterium sp.]|uniref:L-rhamnose mutarotase n=1 Tax=Salinibacterium sp. TaxID=1915057 RepID=UPI00286A46F9|nr:L-rhamnose mutarotase [Salinibacterium sp.]
MRRIASVIGLRPGSVERYEALHAAVWPAVLRRLSASNVANYSIYRHGELLFSYMEYVGDDFDADMAEMAADKATQEWWAVCSPLQDPLDTRAEGEWWKEIPEVFHLE